MYRCKRCGQVCSTMTIFKYHNCGGATRRSAQIHPSPDELVFYSDGIEVGSSFDSSPSFDSFSGGGGESGGGGASGGWD